MPCRRAQPTSTASGTTPRAQKHPSRQTARRRGARPSGSLPSFADPPAWQGHEINAVHPRAGLGIAYAHEATKAETMAGLKVIFRALFRADRAT